MKINQYIDHTCLKADARREDIEKLCSEAKKYQFASVCINPFFVSIASTILEDENVKICTVIGFPLGQNTIAVKLFEAQTALNDGADELDVVINVSAVKDGNWDYVKNELEAILTLKASLKIIIETCYLTDEEIARLTQIIGSYDIDFIKTSTGFGSRGASINDVEIMNKYKSKTLQIKASGGIRDLKTAKAMIEAGATRLGTSSGVKLVEGE